MHSKHETRLAKLEEAVNPSQDTHRVSQVVFYDPVTGEPLTQIDDKAIRKIWIPDNGQGLERIAR